MIYRERLEGIRKELIERKGDILLEMEGLPEGELMITSVNGYDRYLQRLPAVGNRKKERRYGIKKKPDVLNGLVRKEYIRKAIRTIDANVDIIGKAIENYKPADENSIMEAFIHEYPMLKEGIYRARTSDNEWKNRFSRIEDYHSESLIQTAADGTRMRSKNEVYIASRLDHYGQVYRSDCPTGIPGLYCVPDFTIIRKRDDKIIYWEHLGMMDDMEYRIANKRKMEQYNTVEGELRADLIEAMIQAWLL